MKFVTTGQEVCIHSK